MGKDYPAKLWQEYHSVPRLRHLRLLLQILLADDFDKGFRFSSRNVARTGNNGYARDHLGRCCANCDFVAGTNFMSRLCDTPIEQNKARVTELLSYGAPRAKATEFQEEI